MKILVYAFVCCTIVYSSDANLSLLKMQPYGPALSQEQKNAINFLATRAQPEWPTNGIISDRDATHIINLMCYYLYYIPYLMSLEKPLKNDSDIALVRESVDKFYSYCSNNYTRVRFYAPHFLYRCSDPCLKRRLSYINDSYNPVHTSVIRFKEKLNQYSGRTFNMEFPLVIAELYSNLSEQRSQKDSYPNFETYRESIFRLLYDRVLQYESYLDTVNQETLKKFNVLFKSQELHAACYFAKRNYKNALTELLENIQRFSDFSYFKEGVQEQDDELEITLDNSYLLSDVDVKKDIKTETSGHREKVMKQAQDYFISKSSK